MDATAASACYISSPHLERLFIGVQSLLLLDQVLLALSIMQAGICIGVVIEVNLHLHMEADSGKCCAGRSWEARTPNSTKMK